ncbi:MAG: hypothetical protein WAM66_02705 [Acidobacteriaceae bacterium]
MGYSLDNSTSTTVVHNSIISAKVSSGTGSHTVHVKAWGNKGAVCVTDVAVHVTALTSNVLSIPSTAVSVSTLQLLGNWVGESDGSASGHASGTTSIVGSPARTGGTRAFVTKYSNYGDMRYHVSFGDNTTSTNFFYDAWVYLTSSAASIGNIEMDLNQVMPNGQTVIYGVQCDGYTSTWDYTANTGTPQHPNDTWKHSKAYCNPRGWSKNIWHHVQIQYSRDSSGHVTYSSFWLDGHEFKINATVLSAFSLGWAPTLLTNFQVDGLGAGGSNTVYLSDLTIQRW